MSIFTLNRFFSHQRQFHHQIKNYLLGLLLGHSLLTAQISSHTDQLMKHHLLDCLQITYNCLLLIPEYYQKSQLDTMLQLLDYWEQNCQTNMLINRTRLLLAIQEGHYDERIYDKRIIYYLLQYKEDCELNRAETKKPKSFTSLLDSAYAVFDSLTILLARNAYQSSATITTEQLIAEHFMGRFDSTFVKLQSIIYSRSDLQRYYWQVVNEIIHSNYVYYGISGGIWIPQSKED